MVDAGSGTQPDVPTGPVAGQGPEEPAPLERRERRRMMVLVGILVGAALAFGLGIAVGDMAHHKPSSPAGVVLPLP